MTHADNTYKSFTYLSGNRVRERNERGFNSTLTYRSYGNPDEKYLTSIASPIGTTTIGRNLLGDITSVAQGGKTRTYNYGSSNPFLNSETNPETGTTVYGRDALGNMTSRRVGSSSTTTFTYDGQNRLSYINYPTGTDDVDLGYDGNDNLTLRSVIGGQ